ncbi:replicative DNA helicase [Nitrospira sp. T9]|uniref:replicative DNA helicase n=1 Tax=unclassified Nitrospira TaxID=2652172 RepID=UPI003F988335
MSGHVDLYDEAAERSVLSSVVCHNDALSIVRPILTPSDFYLEKHQVIYGTSLRLQDQGIDRDIITVGNALRQAKQLEKIGDSSFLAELAGEYISLSNLVRHSEIIKNFWKRRMVRKAFYAGYLQAQEHPDPEALVAEFYTNMLKGLTPDRGQFVGMTQGIHKFLDLMDRRQRGELRNGYSTGLHALDLRISGLKPENLIILAGRPSMGKTSLACLFALAGSKAGAQVAFLSLEMSVEEQIQRFISLSHDNLTMKVLSHANLTKLGWKELTLVAEGLEHLPIKICDTSSLTIEKIKSMARLLKMKNGVDVLILDYLQLLSLDERGTNRNEALGKVSRELKILAKELGICVVALSQLNRKCEERDDKRPRLSDLRDSGSLEQDADLVLMVYRDEVYNPESAYKGKGEILIRKHRNGPTGELIVEWIGSNSAFKDQIGIPA